MIKKKLGKIMFGWNESALKGKGWWYVLGSRDSFSRAASSKEASSLGMPKESEKPPKDVATPKYYYDVNPKTGKPMRKRIRTESQYEQSDIASSKGLGLLASERMMSGQGVMGSLTGAIGDKLKAKAMGVKKAFDPMNMLSKIPGIGTMAATAYGMKRGRSAADISYFTGVQAPNMEQEEEGPSQRKEKSKGSLVSKIKKADSGILNKIHDMLAEKFEDDRVIRDTENSFKEEEKAETERRHQELIDAILQGVKPVAAVEKEEEKTSIFDKLFSFLNLMSKKFGSIITSLSSLASRFGGTALKVAKKLPAAAKAIAGVATSPGAIAAAGAGAVLYAGLKSAEMNIQQVSKETKEAAAEGDIKKLKFKVAESFEDEDFDQKLGYNPVNPKLDEMQRKEVRAKLEEAAANGSTKAAEALTKLESTYPKPKIKATDKKSQTVSKVSEKKTETKDTTVKLQDMAQPKSVEATYQKLLSESTIEQKKDPMFLQSLKEEAAMLSSVPTAVAQAATPSILGTRATSATLENKNLKEEEMKQSSPVVVNKTTNVVNNGGGSGGSSSVSVRNDEPILTRLQFQNMRPV
jgi:hypothetical protein